MMAKKSLYTVEIAEVTIQIHAEVELLINDSFTSFLTEKKDADVQVFFRQVDELPIIPENVVHKDYIYKVHQSESAYLYNFFNAPKDLSTYAVARSNKDMSRVYIDYLTKGTHCVSELRNCFVHVDLETLLIHRNKFFLHAACVSTHLGGILFSGKSGIGKSTQAELWRKYRNAVHINGDRPILSKEGNDWKAWGSPYAGSSKYHVNQSCTVTAIVMLKQSENCHLRRLNFKEAFRAVWEGVTVHSWDKMFVETASDLAVDLINRVPVYEYYCTPNELAVDYLEKCLRKECSL